jgi:diguanylate cyclase (GGDEF)-like protein
MRSALARVDRLLAGFSRVQILAIAACGALMVGVVDHLTGYEVSISLLYLGPVLMAAWYAGRGAGAIISLLACASWFIADAAAGQALAHPVVEAWNSLVRLSYFIVFVIFAAALRKSLSNERQLARTDALTGLFGRRAFGERLEHDLALARRRSSPLTIAYLDLDDFKVLNDTYGHAEGDRVLRTMGLVLGENRRGGDTVARLGGDEFALVFPDTDERMAQKVIAKLRQNLQKALESGPWRFSCSVGAVTFQTTPPNLEEALSAADALMYDAKSQGKDAVAFKVVG